MKIIVNNIADSVVYSLLEKGIDISKIFMEPVNIGKIENGKIKSLYSEVTITSIENGAQVKNIDDVDINLKEIGKEELLLVNLLKEQNPALKFENLYERLKIKCGNQVKVTKKIKEKFCIKYQINCNNKNINEKFVEKHPDTEYQDDFTYLRTMMAHNEDGKWSDEIEKRVERDTIKIIKVLLELEKEEE